MPFATPSSQSRKISLTKQDRGSCSPCCPPAFDIPCRGDMSWKGLGPYGLEIYHIGMFKKNTGLAREASQKPSDVSSKIRGVYFSDVMVDHAIIQQTIQDSLGNHLSAVGRLLNLRRSV